MTFQILFYAALVALVRGGVIHQAPVAAVSTYAAAAPVAYSSHPSPVATHVSYANPHSQIAYNAHAGHLSYAPAPHLAYAQAPAIAKVIAPVTKTVVETEFDANPQYSYAYDIQDSVTGDSKNHHESRHGDVVQGSYSLTDSDGTRRTVDYTADPINGFNAVVRKEPLAHATPVLSKAITAPIVAKVAPAPFVAKYAPAHAAYHHASVPVSYAAASPAVAYATPVQYVSKFAYASPYLHYKH